MGIKQKQKGFVLIISLVFLISLTALASVLMQNSTSDIKVSGANEQKVIAVQEAISATDELIFRQVNKLDNDRNSFTQTAGAYPQNVIFNDADTTGNINFVQERQTCDASKTASSETIFCNVVTVQVTKRYGNNNNQTIIVNSGITQLLPGR